MKIMKRSIPCDFLEISPVVGVLTQTHRCDSLGEGHFPSDGHPVPGERAPRSFRKSTARMIDENISGF